MSTLLRRGAAVVLCVLLAGALNPIAASAVSLSAKNLSSSLSLFGWTGEMVNAPADFSLTVSPTRLAIGQADIGKPQIIRVANGGQSPIAVTVQKRNFTAGADGVLVYSATAPYSASEWVTADPASFELAPHTSQNVFVTVDVPASPEPGDHQLSLVFMTPAGKTAGNIKINQGIGMVVYITVPGPVSDSATLSGVSAPGFAIDGPVTVTATVRNTGTVHRDFRGDNPLTIDVAGTPNPFPDFTVPRDSVRDISTTWDPPLICICSPSVAFTNADGVVQKMTVQVIVFPLKLLGSIVGALLILILLIWFSRSRYKSSVRKAAVAMNRPAGGGDA